MKKQSISTFLKEDEGLVLPISKSKLISTSNNVFVLDKRKDLKLSELIRFNLNELSSHPNKPYLLLITNQNTNVECEKIKSEGYEVLEFDFFNKDSYYMIDPFSIINEKINYIRKLENQIFNKRGKYLGIGETFISHIEVRAKIQKNKEEVKKQIREFIDEYYMKIGEVENKILEGIFVGILTCYCDDCIKMVENPYKLTYRLINKIILDKIDESKTKLVKYFINNRDEVFMDIEITKILSKIKKDDYLMLQKNAKKVVEKNIIKEKKIDLIEVKDKKPYFIVINDKDTQNNKINIFIFKNIIRSLVNKLSKKRLCIFMSNLEKIEKYEYIFKIVNSNIKIFISTNSISDKIGIYNDYINAFYKTKLLVGDINMESLKEMMQVCKLPINNFLNVDRKDVYKTMKKIKKNNFQASDMLFLNDDNGLRVIKYKNK